MSRVTAYLFQYFFVCLFFVFVVVVVVVCCFFTAGNTKGSITGFTSSHVTLSTYEKVLLT